MTIKQNSDLQRLLGTIEGAAFVIEGSAKEIILDCVQAIDEILQKGGKNNER